MTQREIGAGCQVMQQLSDEVKPEEGGCQVHLLRSYDGACVRADRTSLQPLPPPSWSCALLSPELSSP